MDKLDLIRRVISVAGKCTNCTSSADVAKTVCVDLLPSVIDFVDEKVVIAREKKMREAGAPEPFVAENVMVQPKPLSDIETN